MSTPFLLPRDFVESAEAMECAYALQDAEAYTRWLARAHYENFHVVSFMLPKGLHQDFYNVYAFCRWADDLGDEIGDPEQSLQLLAWWREQLDDMYAGSARHPVFVALQGTAERRALPITPFSDLIRAFIQDQTVGRYETYADLLEYCRYSANPVGRLVLYLCGYSDDERQRLSDATCTALQLANFWQDVIVDLRKDRIYIPLDVLDRYGYSQQELQARRFCPQFRAVMQEVVDFARGLFMQGLPLAGMVDGRLGVDLDLFSRGGLKILEKIEQQDYNVLARRPAISKVDRVRLLLGTLLRFALARAA